MALTFRTNGSGAANIVGASWWDDYFNLLTGVMTDQPVTLSYSPGSSTTTPTLVVMSNGNAPLLSLNNGATSELSVDASGNLSTLGNLSSQGQLLGGQQTGGFSAFATAPVILSSFFSQLAIYCNNADNNWSFVPKATGNPRGIILYGQDSSNTLHASVQVYSSGFTRINALDNGTGRLVGFFEGASTSGQQEGDIWFNG